MKREHIIRLVAGCMILLGLGLYWQLNHWGWLLIPTFVAINLIQSALSKWCLLEDILNHFQLGKG